MFHEYVNFCQKFVISDYNKYKDANDMSTWSPDTRLEQYVRGMRPVFSQPWDAVDIIYVLFIMSNNHWVAIVVHIVNRCIIVYDSKVDLHTDSQLYDEVQPLAYMLPHLLNKFGLKAKGPACFDTPSPWSIRKMDNVPQQSNADCGVYTIKFIDCLTVGFDMANWSSYDIKDIRVRLAVEFLYGSACL
ncbi:hypothetical protein M0R45_030693 [Rubus argutus]|uniref:Ubiquitin-like protease family profile domain-containing protein n=1 Tax=Rubus argutus TaxID=59490 RepID=A0AAW1WDW6_RUBAR